MANIVHFSKFCLHHQCIGGRSFILQNYTYQIYAISQLELARMRGRQNAGMPKVGIRQQTQCHINCSPSLWIEPLFIAWTLKLKRQNGQVLTYVIIFSIEQKLAIGYHPIVQNFKAIYFKNLPESPTKFNLLHKRNSQQLPCSGHFFKPEVTASPFL